MANHGVLVDEGKVLRLGVSNCYDMETFLLIYESARVKPSVHTGTSGFSCRNQFLMGFEGLCFVQGYLVPILDSDGNRDAFSHAEVRELPNFIN
jgi:hypothetical protein